MIRQTHRLFGAVFAALMLLAAMSSAAFADSPESDSDQTITWMVRPSDGEREDGRSWIELELDPGQVVHEYLLVRNLSRSTVAFTLAAADGYFTSTGRFNMASAGEESTGAGSWITIQDTVEVASGADVVVPFTVRVPENATPGDHPAGVAASIRTGREGVAIESRVGFRVMTRVLGALTPGLSSEITGRYVGTWNPFDAGRLTFEYSIANTGNTRLAVTPDITVTSVFGLISFTVPGDQINEIAPGESRAGVATIPDAWPLLMYDADITARASMVPDDTSTTSIEPAIAAVTLIAPPWPQLVTIAALAALLRWVRIGPRHQDTKRAVNADGSDATARQEAPETEDTLRHGTFAGGK